MKPIILKLFAVIFLTSASGGTVLAGDQMPDSSGADQYVKTISITAIKPYPVIEVKSNGEEYTDVENADQKKTFNARVTGVCKNTRWVHAAGYNLNKTKYSGGLVAHKNFPITGPKHKTFGTNKWVNIQWKPDNSMNNRAVQACRDYMQSAKNQGKNLFDILGKDQRIVVDSGVYGNFNLNCAGPLAAGTMHRFDMQPMEVVCKGSPVKLQLDLNKAKLFKITQTSFKPLQPDYTGICPKDFKFFGSVKTNGEQGKFRYRFKNHWGVTGSWKTVQGQKGKSSYPILHTVKLQDIEINENPNLPNQVQNQQGNNMQQIPQMGMQENPWVTLEVQNLANQKQYSKKASYTFKCTEPQQAKLVLNPGNNGNGGKADLIVLADTFRLGSKTAQGGNLVIGAEEASGMVGNQCRFRMLYRIKNQGDADAEPAFTNRVSRGNITLHLANTPKLNQGQSRNISGNLKLPSGKSLLLIKTDHADKVDESNEGNNLARIMVTVKGECGKQTPPRPGSNSDTPPRPTAPTGAPTRPTR